MSKGPNPGYIPGDHWVTCEVCGLVYRESKMKKRWDGAIVCQEDFEQRHPQDFVRATKDNIAAHAPVRPVPTPTFVTVDLNPSDPDKDIPTGTF